MEHFAGLDVSVKDTSVCIVDDTGKIIREVKVASEPEALSAVLKSPAYHFKRIGLEAGPLSQWLLSALAEAGLPAICVETRHMQAVLKAQINKTDRNDARGIALAAGAVAMPTVSRIVWAQNYPTRPITMIVPFAAGGPLDAVGRLLTPRLSEVLGQQVIIENVSGAGGMSGVSRVAKAVPDGYQFILGNIGTHAYNQTLYKRPLYDARNDFAPVGLIGFGFYVLVVRNNLPVNSLPEFIAYAKANQGKMQYGSGGAGSATHISCVLLNQAIGTNITHIPYRGAGPALQELMGGRLDFMCDAIQTSLPHIQAGTVKAIATLSEQRTPLLPDLPTAQQQGLNEFAVYGWSAVFFPKGVDQAMVRRLNAAISEVLDTQSVRERFEALGYSLAAPEQRSPDYLAKFVASEIEKWAGPIKQSGVSMN